jgi:GrpB-like predicted nucleotidyltransferase (UPF0157 family)/N-acetylglutamate synthase-like GNAT family acetyltransferase
VTRVIEVVPYNPKWPQLFEAEAALIKEALGDNCIAIHHIGSTSIPGLSAKPIIDILPVVKDILGVDTRTKFMEDLGYLAKGEYGMAFRRFFQKGTDVKTHNVHVYEEGDPEINRYLKFRDWMRSHPDDREAYATLKLELSAKFPHDILSYCNGKDAFVASIDTKDGYDGWRMVQALTNREWAAVSALQQNFLNTAISTDRKDHIHFVFYKNAEIIGYAHLQLRSKHRAALCLIVIDDRYRNQGFGSQFLKLCERWLVHQGFNTLLVKSSPEAYQFFYKQGYSKMSFDDLNEPSADTQIGKVLTGK